MSTASQKECRQFYLWIGASIFALSMYLLSAGSSFAQQEAAQPSEPTQPQPLNLEQPSDAPVVPERGMSYHDVVRSFGAPSEKKELESRRGDVWTYPTVKIVFQDGRVVAWLTRGDDGTPQSTSLQSSSVGPTPIIESHELDQKELNNLLGEIVADLDSKDAQAKKGD